MAEGRRRTRTPEANGRHQRPIRSADGRRRMWTAKQVGARVGLHPTTVRKRANNPNDSFPIGSSYGPRTRRWDPQEIERWLEAQKGTK